MRNGDGPGRFTIGVALVIAAGMIGGCGPAEQAEPPAADPAESRGEVLAAHEALVAAYERTDAEAFRALIDDGSGFLVFHPLTESRFDEETVAEGGLDRMFGQIRGAHWTDVHLDVGVHGNTAWVTSHVLLESASLDAPFVGRGSEVWVRRPDGWRLVHGHWSENPESFE